MAGLSYDQIAGKLSDVVSNVYRDPYDVEELVDSILQNRTYVRKEGTTLQVDFPQLHSKSRQAALTQLCVQA
jgi:uncharacterized protein (DUF1697 family)